MRVPLCFLLFNVVSCIHGFLIYKIKVGEGGRRRAKAVFGGFKWAEAGGFDSVGLVSARLRPALARVCVLIRAGRVPTTEISRWKICCITGSSRNDGGIVAALRISGLLDSIF